MINTLLSSFLLLIPVPDVFTMCQEVAVEVNYAVKEGFMTHKEAEELIQGCYAIAP